MSLENQYRINELIMSGSSVIETDKENTGNHIVVNDSTKSIINLKYDHKLGDRSGETSGYVEKPKYNEEQLTKAIDVQVDELIKAPPRKGPDVVPRRVYDNLLSLYSQSVLDNRNLTNENISLTSELENLRIEVESLTAQFSSEQLLRANADNQLQIIQERYASTIIDFQNALSKGIQEGIERVSLQAQVEGLRAQKEVLIAQIRNEEQKQASAIALTGLIFEQTVNSGWRIPDANVDNPDRKGMLIETVNDSNRTFKNGRRVYFYNFDTENPATFTFSTSKTWFLYPSKITVPPRVGSTAGVTTVDFGYKPKGNTSDRNSFEQGTLTITTSTGDTMSMFIGYKKEVRRPDTWNRVDYRVYEGRQV